MNNPTNTTATNLDRFHRTNGRVTLGARVEGQGADAQVVFYGGRSEHALFLNVTDQARLDAHWAGYCEDNGFRVVSRASAPVVVFPSKSSPDGKRKGTVIRTTATRVLVAYRFKNGRETTKWVPIAKVTPWTLS